MLLLTSDALKHMYVYIEINVKLDMLNHADKSFLNKNASVEVLVMISGLSLDRLIDSTCRITTCFLSD